MDNQKTGDLINADSQSMLIYYSFEDRAGKVHSGYFWYNCLDCTVNAVLEMDN